jgi:hypothetical protein
MIQVAQSQYEIKHHGLLSKGSVLNYCSEVYIIYTPPGPALLERAIINYLHPFERPKSISWGSIGSSSQTRISWTGFNLSSLSASRLLHTWPSRYDHTKKKKPNRAAALHGIQSRNVPLNRKGKMLSVMKEKSNPCREAIGVVGCRLAAVHEVILPNGNATHDAP